MSGMSKPSLSVLDPNSRCHQLIDLMISISMPMFSSWVVTVLQIVLEALYLSPQLHQGAHIGFSMLYLFQYREEIIFELLHLGNLQSKREKSA
jgi:hypothetical protein